MEENDIKTGKYGWTYGLIGGLAVVALSLMLYLMDMTLIVIQNPSIHLIGVLILIVVMVLGIIQFKKANAGFISISQALKIGVAVGLVSGIISIIYGFIIGMIDPELTQEVSEYLKQQTLTQNPNAQFTDEQWETGMKFQTYIGYAVSVIFPIIVGLIVGAITGAIIKNKRPE